MKQDKQENNDEVKLVEYNTNYFPFSNDFMVDVSLRNVLIGGTRIKGDTNDYEEMNKVIYL